MTFFEPAAEKPSLAFPRSVITDEALNERMKCLRKLADSGDIPAEAWMSLPSPGRNSATSRRSQAEKPMKRSNASRKAREKKAAPLLSLGSMRLSLGKVQKAHPVKGRRDHGAHFSDDTRLPSPTD